MESLAINAMVNLLATAGKFAAQLRDDWYKVSAELDGFPTRVVQLRSKHELWVDLQRKYGFDNDELLTNLGEAATAILEKEMEHFGKLEESKWRKVKQRAFPGQLTSKIDAIEKIVDKRLEVLKHRVESHDVAERNLDYTPVPLPFGPDQKYVPIAHSIDEVKAALENASDSSVTCHRVVTVYGGPGLGKTCLLKHLALHYTSATKQQADGKPTKIFPDGVFYLPCGRGERHNKIKQLRSNLTNSLGSVSMAESRAPTDSTTEEWRGENLLPYGRKVRLKLEHQKVLIIVDDIWEREVLEAVLIPGEAVTYLLSSQLPNIWPDAKKVCMKNPTREEATQILTMYTEGLAEKAELPDNIKGIAQQLFYELQFHPLTLAHVGLAMSATDANDADEWRRLRESWRDQLPEQDGVHPMFQETYGFALTEAMNRMVNSLPEREQSLLFLICLFEDHKIPEAVVRRFRKHLKPLESTLDYKKCRKSLQDKCLIEILSLERRSPSDPQSASVHTRKAEFVIHGVRALCIRRKYAEQLRSMVIQLLEPTPPCSVINESTFRGDRQMMIHSRDGAGDGAGGHPSGWAQGVYTTVMGLMYLKTTFWDVVATRLQRLLGGVIMIRSTDARDGDERALQVLDNATTVGIYLSKSFWSRGEVTTKVHTLLRSVNVSVPPRMFSNVDVVELMERARKRRHGVGTLKALLNPDGEGDWKEEAHWHAKKVILKFICRDELDDESTARLIQLPQTTSAMCETLETLLRWGYWSSTFFSCNKTFSGGHAETTKSLRTVLDDNRTASNIRRPVIHVLLGNPSGHTPGVLDYESRDTIVSTGRVVMNLVHEDDHLMIRDINIGDYYVFFNHVTANFQRSLRDDFVAEVLKYQTRTSVALYNLPEVWKVLMLPSIKSASDIEVPPKAYDGQSYSKIVEHLLTLSDRDCVRITWRLFQWRCKDASTITDDPGLLDMLCNLAASVERRIRESGEVWHGISSLDYTGRYLVVLDILKMLSGIPENREQIWANERVRNSLSGIITSVTKLTLRTQNEVLKQILGTSTHVEVLCQAFSILGNLGLSENLRERITSSFPILATLHNLERHAIAFYDSGSSLDRGVTLLCGMLLYVISKVRTVLDPVRVYTQNEITFASHLSKQVLRGRFDAFCKMQMYEKASVYTDMEKQSLENFKAKFNVYVDMDYEYKLSLLPSHRFGSSIVYVETMIMKDYVGALKYLNKVEFVWRNEPRRVQYRTSFEYAKLLGERGVVRRLLNEDLFEARMDFDASLKIMHDPELSIVDYGSYETGMQYRSRRGKFMYRLLRHRGYVKYLLGDHTGAREDARAAQNLEFLMVVSKSHLDSGEPAEVLALPVTYMGFHFNF